MSTTSTPRYPPSCTSPWRCVLWAVGIFAAFLIVAVPIARAQSRYPSRTDAYINDYAEIVSAEDAVNIRKALSDLKTGKGIEMVVLTINSIHDYGTGDTTIESFATHVFNTWGIGDKQRNDGVLLLVAVKDRTVRIELGSGYGSGHSPEMQAVIDNYVIPEFKQNAYSRGIYRGTQAVVATLTGGQMPSPSQPASPNRLGDVIFATTCILGTVLFVVGFVAGITRLSSGNIDWGSGSSRLRDWGSSLSRDRDWGGHDSDRGGGSSSGGGGSSSGGGASGKW